MKKKIIIGLCVFLGVGAASWGIWAAVSRANAKTIKVAPVSDMSTQYWGDDVSMSGTVSSNATQEVHLTDKQVVDQVFVTEGEAVDVGTPLLSYDMTLVNLDLEAEKLNKEGLEIKKKGLENDLAKLKKTKPVNVSMKGTTGGFQALSFTADVENATIYEVLDEASVPYKGTGTKEDPFCFRCKLDDGTTLTGRQYPVKIKGVFLNIMKQEVQETGYCFVRLEMNNGDNILVKASVIDGSTLTQIIEDDKEYTMYLSQVETEPTPLPTPEATETPSPTETPAEKPEEEQGDDQGDDQGEDDFFDGDILDIGDEIPAEEIMDGYTKDELNKMIQEKQEEIKTMELDIKQSNLKLEKLQKNVENQTVTSTLKGTVKTVGDPEKGEVDDKAFLVVESSEGLYVRGTVSELMLDSIKPGETISGMAQESGVAFDAEIREVSPYPTNNSDSWGGNMNSSYYPFTAYIADGTGLKNQEYVQFNVTVGADAASNAIYLPKAYVRTEGSETYVYLADENGKLKKQAVTTGKIIYGYYIEIKSGVTSEDLIAFPYGKGVKAGAATEQVTMDQMMM